MKKLEEIDFLRLKNFDNEIDNLLLMIELSRTKAKEANDSIKRLNPARNKLYIELKKKYELDYDFSYNKETGEIILNKPASPLPPQSKS